MIGLILAGAAFLTLAMGFIGLPRDLAEFIGGLHLSPFALMLLLMVFFIVLGCFLDGISMVVLTMAVLLPTVQAAGFDLIWFGIFVVLVVEMAQITPPVGFNLFVLQGLTGRELPYLARTALPLLRPADAGRAADLPLPADRALAARPDVSRRRWPPEISRLTTASRAPDMDAHPAHPAAGNSGSTAAAPSPTSSAGAPTARSSRTSCCRENPEQYRDAAVAGIRHLLGLKPGEPIPPAQVECVKMGTTVATNALLERKGEPTLLVTTRGFRDALRIAYQDRPRLFDRHIVLPELLYSARDRGAGARRRRRRRWSQPLDEAHLRERLRAAFDAGLRSVAIVFMHGYRYPAHEQAAARAGARGRLHAGQRRRTRSAR